jgi:acyl carrier protein
MTSEEILASCSRILGDLLASPQIVLRTDTRREDVPGWDSFAYISFIAVVEMTFHVKFGVAEVESFQTVGDIVRRIQQITSVP